MNGKKKPCGWIGTLIAIVLVVAAIAVAVERLQSKSKKPRKYFDGGCFEI